MSWCSCLASISLAGPVYRDWHYTPTISRSGPAAKGWNESSPATLRVLIYLDDLTPERAPFTILPRSHLSMHQQSNPYRRFDNHPDMKTVCVDAGGAIIFNVKAFHGTHPNTVRLHTNDDRVCVSTRMGTLRGCGRRMGCGPRSPQRLR